MGVITFQIEEDSSRPRLRNSAGWLRSLHRYASDAMIVVMVLHLLREFSLDRYRGPRWFTWVTGVPIVLLIVAAGITGYWLVWDKLAQYVAVVTTEWLDQLPIFGQSIARNFLSPGSSVTSARVRSTCCWHSASGTARTGRPIPTFRRTWP
jgi:quinol-cytochrome oxidoreductase complex cytochrome b subunit